MISELHLHRINSLCFYFKNLVYYNASLSQNKTDLILFLAFRVT